jgi:hypothetical protein
MSELGYDLERPRYKRLIPGLSAPAARAERARNCDDLIRRLTSLPDGVPPLDLRSHPLVERLVEEPSPTEQIPYKHREDLLDAVICAWTAAIWKRFGLERVQILGAADAPDAQGRRATILAPARPDQRLGPERPATRSRPTPTERAPLDILDEAVRVLRSTSEVDEDVASRLWLLRSELDRLAAPTSLTSLGGSLR